MLPGEHLLPCQTSRSSPMEPVAAVAVVAEEAPEAATVPSSLAGAGQGSAGSVFVRLVDYDDDDDDDGEDSPPLPVVGPQAFHIHRSSPSRSPPWKWTWSPPPFPIIPFIGVSPTPAPAAPHAAAGDEQGPLRLTFVLALLAYVAAVAVAILPDSKDTISGWSTAAKVVFIVLAVVTVALLAVGFMAAGYHVVGTRGDLWVSASCAKLGAMLSSALLVVAISCKLGPWGCVAAVPSAAVVAAVMAAVWIWGDERAVRETVCGWCRCLVSQHHQVAARDEGDGTAEGEGDAKV